MVRQVVTLGTPIQMIEADSSSAQPMWKAVSKYHASGFGQVLRDVDRPDLPVPSTSIYSRTDGIVNWKSCLIERTETSENIRVFGSHCGLGFNAAAIVAIADRLAQPLGDWERFSAPWWLRGAFPFAADLDRSKLPAAAAAA
jgi:hypothetical protein